ncbi:hypothetical protein [Prescottella sp. R16]|uniref:hypothetical protein n=1 Tax=Prescottella sp. R16 TaxID=3064529 RepID=UPI00272E3AAE|nr:hypothetical protein [Prescottella sp. R16]
MPADDRPPNLAPVRRVRRWEWAGVGGLGVAMAVVLSLTAFGQSATDPDVRDDVPETSAANPYEDGRRAAVQPVLDEWARAVRAGDTAALPALFDAAADPGFLDAEIRRARSAAAVPFAEFGYDIGSDPETPVPPEVADRIGASDVWAPTVYLRYAIEGADDAATRKPVALLLARRGDAWTLVSDTAVAGSDRETWRGPWDFGPLMVREVPGSGGRSSIVLGHPEQSAMIEQLATEIGDAVDHVTDVWGEDWSRRAVVVVAGSRDEFASLVGDAHSGADIAAVAVSDAVDLGARTATGQRIVFSPDAAARLTDLTRVAVLRHELTHVAARPVTADGSPLWILEGYADYIGYRGVEATFGALAPTLSAAVSADGPPTSLPADADFRAGGDVARRAYEASWSLAAFVASEYGEQRLGTLYRDLAQGGSTPDRVDSRIRDALGEGAGELARSWGTWVDDQVR